MSWRIPVSVGGTSTASAARARNNAPESATWARCWINGSQRFWWVNQNQTHREEVAGGFMWSPKRNANGARNQFYDNMLEVRPGDIVFSFYGTRMQQIGRATASAETAPKPEFGAGGENWSTEGWL